MLEKILEEIIEQLKQEGCIEDNDAGRSAPKGGVDTVRNKEGDTNRNT